MTLLVVDVGTSGVRTAAVGADARIVHAEYRPLAPSSPAPGLVEFDPRAMAEAALEAARATVAATGRVDAVGIANQRASTIAWSRATGEPLGPGLGWQDLRTVDHCQHLRAAGLLVSPNSVATKAAWLLDRAAAEGAGAACVGTVDSWIAWNLSRGALHVTDASNASSGGLWSAARDDWNEELLQAVSVPRQALPEIVDSSGVVGSATALPGAPPIAGIAGDQQASLVGQGCIARGMAKITFGTGGMLDLCLGSQPPAFGMVGPSGSVAAIAWRRRGVPTWMLEGLVLAAGANVEWLRDGLGLLDDIDQCDPIASSCASSEGVVFVPALVGLGTPYWDHQARGAWFGLSRGTRRAHLVRAVLEGIAQRAADLVEAAERDSGLTIGTLRIDGGMTRNPTFVQAVADASGRRVEVSSEADATTLGAAFLAGLAIGVWKSWDEVAAAWSPARSVEPAGSFDRARWREACRRAADLASPLSARDA